VRVTLLNERDSVVSEARTDSATGAFFFEAAPRHKYQIAIYDRLGNPYMTGAFTIDSGATVERRIVLPDLPAAYEGLPLATRHVDFLDPLHHELPIYPPAMRAAHRSGSVRIAFIINAAGEIEPGSVHVVSTSHPLFTDAVMKVVPKMRFVPVTELARLPRVIDQRTFSFIGGSPNDALGACVDICIAAVGVGR
jgi:TonB family C-terminal domain